MSWWKNKTGKVKSRYRKIRKMKIEDDKVYKERNRKI